MKLADILYEGSADLNRVRDMFVSRWKKIMKPKSRKNKLDYVEKLVDDILTKDEIRFLVIQLQKKK